MSDGRHIMLAVGLFIAVLVLGGFGLVLPNAGEVRDIRDRIEDLQFRSEGVEQTAEMVEQLSRMAVEAKKTVDQDLKIIPEEPGIASLIRLLSLSIDGVTVQDQTFDVGSTFQPSPESHESILAVPVTMKMKATFESIYAVLRAVESMDRLVRLRSVRIQTAADKVNRHDEPILETVLILEAVYQEASK